MSIFGIPTRQDTKNMTGSNESVLPKSPDTSLILYRSTSPIEDRATLVRHCTTQNEAPAD